MEVMLNHQLNPIDYRGVSSKYYIPFSINMGFYFTNILNIETKSLCLNWINQKNSNRQNVIWELHKNGFSNREICDYLTLNGYKRRNKKDNYNIKDVFMCLKKLKIKEERINDTKFKLGKWIVNRYKY